jgi:putative spermidine/putrescine transport system substrate-binding protein
MIESKMGRRQFIGVAAGFAAFTALGNKAFAQMAMPKSPVVINVIDATGDLALRQKAFENYLKARPNLVSRITYTKAPQPELPGKIKAQQDAHHVDIDLVLTSYDGMSIGIDQNLWMQLLPTYAASLPKPDAIYLEGAYKIQQELKGYGLLTSYSPYGPLLEYMPDRVKQMPTTAGDLLAWSRQNKNRITYPRPANSGPARALLVGLPYILGDANPRDPLKGWDKTWAYLKALGENIDYYPSGTSVMLKEFGEGTRDIIPTTTGWDINPRAIGVVPKEARIATLKGFHFCSDAHCVAVPKGVSAEKLPVLLDLIAFLLRNDQQALSFDHGYFYPGPAVKGATLDMAPPDSQKVIKEFGRPEYEQLIANTPVEPPLDPAQVNLAFRRWDEQIGSAKRT